MHGFKSAILAEWKNCQNGTFALVQEIQILFCQKTSWEANIHNFFQGPSNPGFRSVKVQTQTFLKKDSRDLKNSFQFRFLWIPSKTGGQNQKVLILWWFIIVERQCDQFLLTSELGKYHVPMSYYRWLLWIATTSATLLGGCSPWNIHHSSKNHRWSTCRLINFISCFMLSQKYVITHGCEYSIRLWAASGLDSDMGVNPVRFVDFAGIAGLSHAGGPNRY